MRRFILAALAALMALILAAPALAAPSVDAGLRSRSFRPCYTAPHERDQIVALARHVLDRYEVVAPEDEGPSRLTSEIKKAVYFGRLDCFTTLLESAIRNEVRRNQPSEDANAAIDWLRDVIRLNT